MELKNAVAVVTGANRGLGRHLAAQLVERGAKVYAAARRPETVDVPGAVPLRLDVTDEASIREAARTASDTTLLINNAGISTGASLIGGETAEVRREMETNFFGLLAATRSFVPVIEGNGGGAVLNVLSVLSWLHPAALGSYAASKAASWALTDAVRDELAPRGIAVSALHVGYMDTDMASGVPADQKVAAADVAA
ncbi:short-chain dehydrogenase [Streptomyces griseoluteus]|nr:short-chain dehydrogenase [Streptomyces griseoluteus]